MDKKILESERFDLSGSDIMRMTDGKTKIISYEQLEHINSLEELLHPYGAVIILYQTSANHGHWVVVLDKGNKQIEFYDPYGIKPDEELNIDNAYHLRIHGGRLTPHFSALILKGGFSVEYNKERLQRVLAHVNTCGRYCVLRVIFRSLSLKEFNKLLTGNKHYTPDFWVSALTLLG